MADKDEQTEEQQIEEQQETTEQALLDKNTLMTSATETPPVEEYERVKLRGLTGKEHAHVKAQVMSGPRPLDDDSRAEYNIHEIACWLAAGIVDPDLSVQEWETVIGGRPAGQINNWYERIQELTGLESAEIKAAKKVFREMPELFGNSTSPSNT